jgi:hypothetical protein
MTALPFTIACVVSGKARPFQVTVESGESLVKGPYVAETFPVSVEEDYLVIDQ